MAVPCVISTGPDQDLFAYTAGRYIFNEKRRLEERYAEFDVEALKTVAASSVGRDAVLQIKKLAEGGFNRVFVLTMSDGFEVIAKTPYPVTVPTKLATESEVATLDFLRTRGIPVPQVYAYSSQSNNAVGTEYIIMEKAPGQPLDRRWFDLTPKERVQLVTSYVDIERKLFSIPFGSYGSLYYTHSIHPHLQHDIYRTPHKDDSQARFCIGPSADYTFWRGKRASLDLERGPCQSFTPSHT
ncbi:uncharacterized protein LDX57_003068 [Aspergillus melleus]|uniref:uncharacterized protein n=1 Tax=Aspergillus melleus TaxID=138277 RepID=UPI001E8CFBF8|nr:uncharacterized protein LDX57_003068 [Aspergillus melleus]KAH8425311.1 hypothetical protein LDX57_003068 [Aspergillus melleus]